ncbi:hypothetical protein L2V44_14170, partial [Staphylococcus aureus]|nr:hypothetical protein [Staphylococcus aureus]
PSYVKFMKEILSNKRKLEEFETVALTEECSAILQKKLPPKLKDPGNFNIPCTIGNSHFDKAPCDLGASINSCLFRFTRNWDWEKQSRPQFPYNLPTDLSSIQEVSLKMFW